MSKLYWYKVTKDFYSLGDLDNIVELRRESFSENEKGKIVGEGDLFLVTRKRANEYYKELGLEFSGYEEVEVEEYYL